MGNGRYGSKGPVDGWREGGCTDKKSQASGPTDGVEVSRPAVDGQFEGTRCKSARQGGQGEGIETQQAAFRCILSLVLPPAPSLVARRKKVWECGRKVGVGVL